MYAVYKLIQSVQTFLGVYVTVKVECIDILRGAVVTTYRPIAEYYFPHQVKATYIPQ